MSLELTVGDTAPDLTGTVSANLTGAAVEVHVLKPDGTVIDRAPSIVSAAGGTWSLPWISGDLSVRGVYTVEVQVTFSSGKVQTFKLTPTGSPNEFEVTDQIA